MQIVRAPSRERTLRYLNLVRVSEEYHDLLASEVVQALLTKYADIVPVRIEHPELIADIGVNAAFDDAPLLYALSHVAEFCAVTVAVDEDGTLVFRADAPRASAPSPLVLPGAALPDHVRIPNDGQPVYHRATVAAVRAQRAHRKR